MHDAVAQRVRRLIADHLGVSAEDLAPHVSLRDDLAADSLDLLEVSVALEDDLGIAVPERLLADVRTVGDLVDATLALARERRRGAQPKLGIEEPVHVCSKVVPPAGAVPQMLERSDWLTPYTAEAIREDALHAGRGARLEVTVDAATTAAGVSRVLDAFGSLGDRGIELQVRREGTPSSRRAKLFKTA
ncbi:MAG TPA: acyl carrier protein [Candidatus Binatia bacterium]|jgi:acyl carrier protein|nr:acyl carrier protein [Candidatus Binatia bacterium]